MDAPNTTGGQPPLEGRRESFGSQNSQTAKEYAAVPNVHKTKLTTTDLLSLSSS
jgi:hypothetical protein